MNLNNVLSLKMRRMSFIATLTVVWVHAFNLDERYLFAGYTVSDGFSWNAFFQLWVCNGLFRYAIPLFFTISGYLMAHREGLLSYNEMLGKRARMLLYPYLGWSIIGLLLTLAWEQHAFLAQFVESSNLKPHGEKDLLEYSVVEWLLAIFIMPVSFQLWFLRSLFIYSALYPLLAKAIVRQPGWYFGVVGVFWLLSADLIVIGSDGLLFFGMGIWLQKSSKQAVYQTLLQQYGWTLFAGGITCSLLKTAIAFESAEWLMPIGYFAHKLMQLMLIGGVWFVYDRWWLSNRITLFDQLSATNFFIYGMHVPVVYFLTDLLFWHFGKSDTVRLSVFVLLPLALIVLAMMVAMGLKRWWPWAFGVLCGFRKYELK